MNTTPILVVLLILLCTASVPAQHFLPAKDYSYHTSHRLGDTVAVYSGEARISSHLYIFADESSCFTCMMSLQPVIATIRSQGHTKATLFLRGASPEYIRNIAEKYGWDFEVVDDRIGAYMDKFRIRRVPFYFLIDARGVLHDMGEIATVDFDLDRLLKITDEIAAREAKAKKNAALVLVRRIPVKDGKEPLLAGKIRFVSYDPIAKGFVVLGPGSLVYSIVDSSGAVKKTVDLAKLPQFQALTPLPMSLTPKPGVLLGGDSELENAERVLYYLDYNRDSLKLLQAPQNTDHYLVGYEFLYTPGNRIVIGLHPREYGDIGSIPNFRTTMMLDSLARPIGNFGAVPQHYKQYYLEGFYWTAFTCDQKGRIYQMHNFGDMVYVYTSEGVLQDSMKCDLNTSLWYRDWRKSAAKLNANTSIEVKKEMGDQVSKLASLLYDHSTDNLYMVYTNRMLPGQSTVTGKLYYYLHRVRRRGDNADIEIPNNGIPFYIDSELLYTTELNGDNALEIVVYSLKGG